MKDRIREIMMSQHMTQQTFANFIGMSPATLSSIFNDRTHPTLNTVEAIKNKIPAINTDWLMFGKGSMYLDDQPEDEAATGSRQMSNEQVLDFGDASSTPSGLGSGSKNTVGVNQTLKNQVRTEVKYIDKPARQITEIRVYFDDQTWESFVPKK